MMLLTISKINVQYYIHCEKNPILSRANGSPVHQLIHFEC